MFARVVVLPEDDDFIVAPRDGKEGFFLDKEERESPDRRRGPTKESARAWRDATLEFVRMANPAEPFGSCGRAILMPFEEAESFYIGDYLRRLIERARRAVWGGQVYLVVSPKPWSQDSDDEFLSACRSWSEVALEAGVTDIMEIRPPILVGDMHFHKSIVRSASRRNAILAAPRTAPWRIALPSQTGGPLMRFVSDFGCKQQPNPEKTNLVVGVNRSDSIDQLEEVIRAAARLSALDRLIVTIGCEAGDALRNLAAKEGIKPPLKCVGGFELRYLLLQLNARYSSESAIRPANVKEVRVDTEPLFVASVESGTPILLLTSAFSPLPKEQGDHCIEAARDMDEILHAAPRAPSFRIHQNATLPSLSGLVTSITTSEEYINAWIHMGHGKEGDGLLQYDEDETRGTEADRWLVCFEGHRKKSLPLVFLGACYSDNVARRFAQAGAGVAIGFGGRVVATACRELVRPVVDAALRYNGDPDRILQAFASGCQQLEGFYPDRYSEAQPFAFRSKK